MYLGRLFLGEARLSSPIGKSPRLGDRLTLALLEDHALKTRFVTGMVEEV